MTIRDGIPTTTPTRTLLDIASVMTDGDLLRALRQAGHLRLFDRAAIDAVIARAPRPGRGRLAAAMRAMTVTGSEPRATHATAEAFEADRARDARLLAAGYRVVRFTYRQVTSEPEAVARTIRSLLAVPGIAT